MTERDELLQAFDAALAAMETGASLESVLAADPARAAELRPLLRAALAAGAGAPLARVPAQAQAASRAQFLAAADHKSALALVPAAGPWARLRAWLLGRGAAGSSLLARAAAVVLVALAGLSIGGYGAVAASAQSLPGDALYGVKRTVESTELLLAADAQTRARLQTEFDDRRVHEAQAVAGQGRQVAVEFTGTLNSINGAQGQQWLVSGIAVVVGPQVPVVGVPVVGGRVHIQGMVQTAGQVQAQRVTVLPDQAGSPPASSTATAMPSPTLPATATVTQTPVPPATASGMPETTIEVPEASAAPSASATRTSPPPSATLAATASNTPTASSTPAATATATQGGGEDHGSPSPTPAPTDDHGGGPGPSASNTPQPTETADHGSSTSTPEATDDGGDHGGDSNTPEPTDSGGDHGGGGPSPSNTPNPTNSGGGPSPSNTPKAEE